MRPALFPSGTIAAPRPPALTEYGVAAVCVAAAAGTRLVLEPLLEGAAPLLIFVLPTVVVAFRSAPGAALFATILSTVVGATMFIESPRHPWIPERSDQVRLLVFAAANLVIVVMAFRLQRANRRLATAGAAVEDSARTLGTIMDTTTHAIITTDPVGHVIAWNRAAEEMFGWTAEEVLGGLAPHVPDDARAETVGLYGRALSGERLMNLPVERQRRDGTRIPCQLSLAALRQGHGGMRGVVATLVDVSNVRALEEQLRQAQKMEAVGQLAAGLAHDFNNQLTAILGYAELASDGATPGGRLQQDLTEIVRAGRSAASLTRQLLAFSRHQVLQIEPIDAVDVLRSSGRMLRRAIREAVAIQMKLPDEPLWIRADHAQVEHILLNLVVNARDAMPSGGTVTIEAASVFLDQAYSGSHLDVTPGEHVVVAVTDTGDGMTRDVQARIFEAFFTTKEAGKGTGLGLAMVYDSVRQMGGSIWVYTEPGHGTTFKLYFPRIDAEGSTFEATQEPEAAGHGHETVLVVDDDDMVRQLTTRTLQDAGYRVLSAADPWAALQHARDHNRPINLLVSDVIMPGMHGPALAQQLVGEFSLEHVLYTSGYADQPHLREQVARGSVHFLAKPFTPSEIRAAARRVLDKPPHPAP